MVQAIVTATAIPVAQASVYPLLSRETVSTASFILSLTTEARGTVLSIKAKRAHMIVPALVYLLFAFPCFENTHTHG